VNARSCVLADSRVGLVELSGEIDLATVPTVRQAIGDQLAAGMTLLLLDLSAVTFIDSTGLGVLVGAGKKAAQLGGAIRVVSDNPRVVRLLTLTGLTLALGVHANRESALRDWVSQAC
jgi:anti-sigma B factor antagonist